MTIPERLNQIEHALIHEPMDADRLEAERTKLLVVTGELREKAVKIEAKEGQ